jgi:hypothetical protein
LAHSGLKSQGSKFSHNVASSAMEDLATCTK